MHSEDNLLPLSALQHILFCPRQCALIHTEQQWSENLLTAQGRLMHDKTHSETRERRTSKMKEYGMALRSLELGLSGKADCVEYKPDGSLFPVEYKRGKPKKGREDEVQLCAQALCLEEMLGVHIPSGALYYGKTHRRKDVLLDDALRKLTKETAENLHNLIHSGVTPPARYEKRCDSCSLLDLCMPEIFGGGKNVKNYMAKMLKEDPS